MPHFLLSCVFFLPNSVRPYGKKVPYESYWAVYEGIMRNLGGRPHWAKVRRGAVPCLNQLLCSLVERPLGITLHPM